MRRKDPGLLALVDDAARELEIMRGMLIQQLIHVDEGLKLTQTLRRAIVSRQAAPADLAAAQHELEVLARMPFYGAPAQLYYPQNPTVPTRPLPGPHVHHLTTPQPIMGHLPAQSIQGFVPGSVIIPPRTPMPGMYAHAAAANPTYGAVAHHLLPAPPQAFPMHGAPPMPQMHGAPPQHGALHAAPNPHAFFALPPPPPLPPR